MKIDLTETIKIFYKKLKEWISQDAKLMTLIVEKQADIKINYMRREQLPDEVRPKDTQVLNGEVHLGKRKREDDDNQEKVE